jgi:hypothetical protein
VQVVGEDSLNRGLVGDQKGEGKASTCEDAKHWVHVSAEEVSRGHDAKLCYVAEGEGLDVCLLLRCDKAHLGSTSGIAQRHKGCPRGLISKENDAMRCCDM